MRKLQLTFLLVFLIITTAVRAQFPQKPSSAEIYNQILKLNFLGSVLYIAAHPDDENTRLISYMANELHARTGYLSLTRGDGGQNLIGPQLRELLGVIRTQELLEARKIDGGEQFFSRANDFGYSKTPVETLQIWDKKKVLADLVWTIRKFQPDIIINRFDHRTAGSTHGHHTASALLSMEGFDLSNQTSSFPEQLQWVTCWQPKRIFYNTSWWFYGSKEKFDAADKTYMTSIPTGVYYPTLGKSNQEIAALSRSCHKSQGFGSSGIRGEESEYLEFLKGMPLPNKGSLFEGIDTSWNRVKGGIPIGELMSQIARSFDFKNPASSIPNLLKAYTLIQALEENHWKRIKTEEIKNTIAACAGLYLEAVSTIQQATPGSQIKVNIEAINRSEANIKLLSVTSIPAINSTPINTELKNNIIQNQAIEILLPSSLAYTQAYWLDEQGSDGLYTVKDQQNIGIADIIRQTKLIFNLKINGLEIPYERIIVYKYNDDVKGEKYNYLDIVPAVSTSIEEKVLLFTTNKPKYVKVNVKAGKNKIKGDLKLEVPSSWKVSPASIDFKLDKIGEEQSYYFELSPPEGASEISIKSIASIDGILYDKEQINITYDHISKQQVLRTAEAKCIRFDLKTNGEKIAYIMGAGDEVPRSLAQMGYKVTVIKAEDISDEKLSTFDVVMTGIRAYNTVEALAHKQSILFDFVKSGKTMIVQYNTIDDLVTSNIAPYPLQISRDRVTDENAEVRFISPNHPVLNYPNRITAADFKGWKQEQGLYYPHDFDKAFTPILSSNDKGENPKEGSLLVAPYGKGTYIYTGLSLFRELPEAVPGAYRLLSNLISTQSPESNPNQKLKP